MIDPKELRIDNLFRDRLTSKLLAVAEVNSENVLFDILGDDQSALPDGWQAEPIPLTPEVLQKCGRLSTHSDWEYEIPVGALKWYFRHNIEWYSEIGGIYIDSRVQHLHQLQNLYFALYGNELNYQP